MGQVVDHQSSINPLDVSAWISSTTTVVAGLSLQETLWAAGIFGMILTGVMQIRRDRRESAEHRALMQQLELDHKLKEKQLEEGSASDS